MLTLIAGAMAAGLISQRRLMAAVTGQNKMTVLPRAAAEDGVECRPLISRRVVSMAGFKRAQVVLKDRC
jgi:hypothetical protein